MDVLQSMLSDDNIQNKVCNIGLPFLLVAENWHLLQEIALL